MYGLLKCKEKRARLRGGSCDGGGGGCREAVATRQTKTYIWCLRLAYHSGSDKLSCGQNWGAASARIEY
jgi:hypothetical protein